MHEIRIPRLGWSMEEGTFLRWLKQPGEEITAGEPLFELEGEKALQEVEAVAAGRLYVLPDAPSPGSIVPVGTLLGYLLAPGEEPPVESPPAAGDPLLQAIDSLQEDASAHAAESSALPHQPRTGLDEIAAAASSGLRPDTINQRSPEPRSGDFRDENASTKSNGTSDRPVASPRARRVARELGIDWSTLQGSGQDGRIREVDVLAASGKIPVADRDLTASSTPASGPFSTSLLRASRRKTIADRLRISQERTIPVTLTTVADATHLVGLREQFKAAGAVSVPAYTDLAACLVASVLKQHPQLLVRWNERDQSLVPVPEDQIDIGIAVDTSDGLLVPVLRNLGSKSLLQVTHESRALIERARAGTLPASDLQGGVFTITNLGSYGIDAFTPVINYPEIAILGIGALRREAVVLPDDRIVPQWRITLSLTFDHAALDGAPAAGFLRDLATAFETPAARLLQR